MDQISPLTRAVERLPSQWKWVALFTPPAAHDAEWRSWLAQAQRAEQAATLRYWSTHVDHAA